MHQRCVFRSQMAKSSLIFPRKHTCFLIYIFFPSSTSWWKLKLHNHSIFTKPCPLFSILNPPCNCILTTYSVSLCNIGSEFHPLYWTTCWYIYAGYMLVFPHASIHILPLTIKMSNLKTHHLDGCFHKSHFSESNPIQTWGISHSSTARHHFSTDDFLDWFELLNAQYGGKAIKTHQAWISLNKNPRRENREKEKYTRRNKAKGTHKEKDSKNNECVCVCVCVCVCWALEPGGDSPWLMLPLTQPHTDSLLNLNAGQSSVSHLVPNCWRWGEKKEEDSNKDA